MVEWLQPKGVFPIYVCTRLTNLRTAQSLSFKRKWREDDSLSEIWSRGVRRGLAVNRVWLGLTAGELRQGSLVSETRGLNLVPDLIWRKQFSAVKTLLQPHQKTTLTCQGG